MDDSPAALQLTEDKRKLSFRIVACSRKRPASEDHCSVLRQDIDAEIAEIERAHPFSGRIAFLISIERTLPAARYVIARREDQVIRIPVPEHETVDVAAIPGCGLSVHDRHDLAFDPRLVFRRLSGRGNAH